MSADPPVLDEARVRAALDRAARARARDAGGADAAAHRLFEEAAERLFDRLAPVRIEPARVVDVAAHGLLQRRVLERFPKARVAAFGPSVRTLAAAAAAADDDGRPGRWRARWRRQRRRPAAAVASFARLPLAAGAADLVLSNLALHWSPDPAAVLREMARVLRPGGLAAFGTFGPDTLGELRASWAAVDGYAHTIDFADLHDLGDAMLRAGFADVVMDAERVAVTWPDLPALLADLRALGAGNPHPGRARGLTTPRRLAALARAYERRRAEGRLPATLELVYGHGWKPQAPRPLEVPLERLAAARPRRAPPRP